MKFEENDTVILMVERPQDGLKKGDLGTVVAVYHEPNEACEVEFVNESGVTTAQVVFEADEYDLLQLCLS